jgi:hypothetical protein
LKTPDPLNADYSSIQQDGHLRWLVLTTGWVSQLAFELGGIEAGEVEVLAVSSHHREWPESGDDGSTNGWYPTCLALDFLLNGLTCPV